MTADERTAIIAAGWTIADAPELPGAHWRHPSRGVYVYPTSRVLALIIGQPGVMYGLCHCGCGEPTRIADRTRPRDGWVKGEPVKYIMGHAGRLQVPAPRPTAGPLEPGYRIAGKAGVGLCAVCGEPVPSAFATALYCGRACHAYAAEQRRRAKQPTRAEVAA